jgi:hypothetical protein
MVCAKGRVYYTILFRPPKASQSAAQGTKEIKEEPFRHPQPSGDATDTILGQRNQLSRKKGQLSTGWTADSQLSTLSGQPDQQPRGASDDDDEATTTLENDYPRSVNRRAGNEEMDSEDSCHYARILDRSDLALSAMLAYRAHSGAIQSVPHQQATKVVPTDPGSKPVSTSSSQSQGSHGLPMVVWLSSS